jgi:hypothetical protein
MSDFNLISGAERRAVLDVVRRRVTSAAEIAEVSARVQAAQTHAGLDAILQGLPPEKPPAPAAPRPVPTAAPRPQVFGRGWLTLVLMLLLAYGLVALLSWHAGKNDNVDDSPAPRARIERVAR